jgi:hypothetical protein
MTEERRFRKDASGKMRASKEDGSGAQPTPDEAG